MAKTVSLESLPTEIGAALYRIDKPERFSVEAFRHESITVVNKRLSSVYKFVRRNKNLVLQLQPKFVAQQEDYSANSFETSTTKAIRHGFVFICLRQDCRR
jgi:hypothetical protein